MFNAAKKEGGGPRSEALPKTGKPDIFRHRGDYVVRFRRARLFTDPYIWLPSAATVALGTLACIAVAVEWSYLSSAAPLLLTATGIAAAATSYFFWKQGRRGHEINQIRVSGNILITADKQVFSRHELHSFYATTVMDEGDPDQFRKATSKRSNRYAVRARYGSLRRPVTIVANVLTEESAQGVIALLEDWKKDEEALVEASTGLHGRKTLLEA